ncbi:MAG: hypothetical protein GY940_37680 [bacterium]|nr:hypothetical protein [bacterium]
MGETKFNRRISKGTIFPFLLVMAALIVGTAGNLMGQGMEGTWYDARYKIKLVLYSNGAYQMQHANGASQGRYNVSGNTFCLIDQSGAGNVCYTVAGYNANQLVLRDANGVTMNFQRQQTPSTNTGKGKVLAQKNNFTLTTAHLDIGTGLTQFIIGQPIKPAEVEELKAKLIEEFNQLPGKMMKELASLGDSLQKVRTLTNPVQIGYARQQLFAALYKATRQMAEHQKPLMIQVMNRYIKVLAYDEANNLVLTDKDACGMMHYLAFNSELMGQKVQLNQTVYNSVAAEMVKNFPAMPVQQKQLLCSASLLWKLVEYNWNQLTPAQRQQYKNSFAAQMRPNYQQYQPSSQGYQNYTPPANTSGKKKSAAEMMMDYNAKQHMFQMMNNMNMNSHALSMNIIENIGGTDNYWKVVDY